MGRVNPVAARVPLRGQGAALKLGQGPTMASVIADLASPQHPPQSLGNEPWPRKAAHELPCDQRRVGNECADAACARRPVAPKEPFVAQRLAKRRF